MDMKQANLIEVRENAGQAADYLKMLASEQRLMLLCALMEGEHSVGELADQLGSSQPNVSQHLAKLRAMHIVDCQRSGKVIRYRLVDSTVRQIVKSLYAHFCASPELILE